MQGIGKASNIVVAEFVEQLDGKVSLARDNEGRSEIVQMRRIPIILVGVSGITLRVQNIKI